MKCASAGRSDGSGYGLRLYTQTGVVLNLFWRFFTDLLPTACDPGDHQVSLLVLALLITGLALPGTTTQGMKGFRKCFSGDGRWFTTASPFAHIPHMI